MNEPQRGMSPASAPEDKEKALLREAEALEARGARERVAYYVRLLGPGRRGRLLDVGCGNGYAVDEWRSRGFEGYGVDCSVYRLGRWIAEGGGGRGLVLADAARLPFADGAFSDVISSGMIEHVGVEESAGPYSVRALPNRDGLRERVLGELVRVGDGLGAVLVDCPNGAFAVDFWHGDRIGSFRLHRIPDTLLPTFGAFRRWARRLGRRARLTPLSRRLSFRQVGRRWWGRLLRPAMAFWLWSLDLGLKAGLGRLLAPLYPYLVVALIPLGKRQRASPNPGEHQSALPEG